VSVSPLGIVCSSLDVAAERDAELYGSDMIAYYRLRAGLGLVEDPLAAASRRRRTDYPVMTLPFAAVAVLSAAVVVRSRRSR
jgi:hypothetical protein